LGIIRLHAIRVKWDLLLIVLIWRIEDILAVWIGWLSVAVRWCLHVALVLGMVGTLWVWDSHLDGFIAVIKLEVVYAVQD
jgi:hypothetical protein